MSKLEICGGCNAKIAAGSLDKILTDIIPFHREDILVGFDTKDDAAVIKITDDLAIIQTLDFFPTMVEDPFLFGQIAAANAMSDVYAMGGEVICALNIAMYPMEADLGVLREVLRGGNDKVKEANATLTGGHSIHDNLTKYGLSVTGKVDIDKIWKNNTPKDKDVLLFTKKLGTGIITASYNQGLVSDDNYKKCTDQMKTLNKYARDVFVNYDIHAATDVTGFGLLGHLSEMAGDDYTMVIDSKKIPILEPAYDLARDFYFTSGGQNNRNHIGHKVEFYGDDYAMEEVLYDPQTSGGLLVAVDRKNADEIIKDFASRNMEIFEIGEVKLKRSYPIIVR